MSEPVLHVHGLCINFGGLAAVDNVSLEVNIGALHAVIGPNGAGKTTLINLLAGDMTASAGAIVFHGNELSRLAPEQRSRLGIGRSYQRTNIFTSFTVFENCRLAAQCARATTFRLVARCVLRCRRRTSGAPGARCSRSGTSRPGTGPGAESRRATPARDRHVPSYRTATLVARRAARRHGRGRIRENDRTDRKARPRVMQSCLSSTTWTRSFN